MTPDEVEQRLATLTPDEVTALSEARGLTASIRTLQAHVEVLADRRVQAVTKLRAEKGLPVPVIAASLGTSVQAVYTWKPKPSEPR